MRLDQIAATAMNQLVGRIIRRAAAAAVMAIFVLVALYQFTVAGTIALEMQHGALNAHLIVAGIYIVLALAAFAAFWMMRPKPATDGTPALSQPREMQLIMLVEAVMLGYALARKK
ncbi:hypothetical protein MXD81_59260 [Microbacteriaceae bacterium K1510]|nr:hypothetical protein [Microbacteriaceae bacterium K1510]